MWNLRELREHIRSTVPLSAVVGTNAVRIRCQIHGSKDPDMHLFHGNNRFKCYGGSCRAHGDVIDYRMLTTGIDFMTALREICDEFGIPFEMPAKRVDILSRAARFFQKRLFAPENKKALHYLFDRKISYDTIVVQRIGLCDQFPDTITEQEAREVGIVNRKYDTETNRYYDSYPLARRIVFPLFDRNKGVIHMQGRIYQSGDERSKYIGLPKLPTDTAWEIPFDISDHLYNEESLLSSSSGEVYLFEGIPDCLIAMQWNLASVCVLGNDKLQRFGHRFRNIHTLNICMDSDPQTQDKLLKNMSMLQQMAPHLTLNHVILDGYKDLNEFALAGGTKVDFINMKDRVSQPFLDRLIADWSNSVKLHQPLLYTVAASRHAAQYVDILADTLKTTPEAIRFAMKMYNRTDNKLHYSLLGDFAP